VEVPILKAERTTIAMFWSLTRELAFVAFFLVVFLTTMPFLFTDTQFYLSSDNLYQAQFGDGPGGVWTLWIFAQASTLVNTEQVDLLFGAKNLWTLEALSQSTWIFSGSILNRLFAPITAFNTLVLLNFYLLSRACLFASGP
jgi:hypothetical protein